MKAPPLPHAFLERVARLLQRAASLSVTTLAFAALALMAFAFAQVAIRGWGAVSYTLSPEYLYPASVAIVVVWCMWMFAAGRKETVLFLRKFGNKTANEMVGGIIRTSFRGKARLFVLDDSLFPSLAIDRRDQLGSFLYVIPFALAIVLFAFNIAATTGASKSAYVTREDYLSGKWEQVPSAGDGDKTEYLAGNPLLAMPYAPFLWFFLMLLSTPVIASGVTAFRGRRVIRTSQDVARMQRAVRWAASWPAAPRVMAPMMTLATCDDAIWRDTVLRLIQQCDFVVIDLTAKTEHIQWELDTCRSLASDRTIVMAVSEATDQDDWSGSPAIRYGTDPATASSIVRDYLIDHPRMSLLRTLRAIDTRP
jgi:hypothetical protein